MAPDHAKSSNELAQDREFLKITNLSLLASEVSLILGCHPLSGEEKPRLRILHLPRLTLDPLVRPTKSNKESRHVFIHLR